MHIRVTREACCSQDDQLGPLEATFAITASTTFGELIAAVAGSKFFQYSSSHTTLQGDVAGRATVELFSSFYMKGKEPRYLVSPNEFAARVVSSGVIRFRFIFSERASGRVGRDAGR